MNVINCSQNLSNVSSMNMEIKHLRGVYPTEEPDRDMKTLIRWYDIYTI